MFKKLLSLILTLLLVLSFAGCKEDPVTEKGTNSEIRAFCKALEDLGINATVRRELGSDISASCGQLRKKTIKG